MKKNDHPATKRATTTRERRKHIVEVAATCFVDQGFHQTSIRDIAKRADISLGNLYNHFENKTALIAEIATLEDKDLVEIREILTPKGKARDVIEAFLNAYFAYVSRPENAVLTAEITAEAMRSPQIVEGFLDNRKALTDALINVLKVPELTFPEQPEDLAETLLALVESAAMRVAFSNQREKAAALDHLHKLTARLFFAS